MSHWSWLPVGVVVGLGTGYLLAQVLSRLTRPPRDSALLEAIEALRRELAQLRVVVERLDRDFPPWRPAPALTESSAADFVSARSASDSEDEFYDPSNSSENPPEASEAYFDDKSLQAQQNQEVATALVDELREKLLSQQDSVGLLWRLSRSLVQLSLHQQGREGERPLLEEAADCARRALEQDDTCWQAHQWYASAVGSLSKFQTMQDKIKQGHEYKEHIEKAISFNPVSPTLHYLRGRWCYEVAGLSWFEKKAASALFAAPPESSFQETLECFLRAEELNPGHWKSNQLMIAKTHLKLGDNVSAVQWLHKALQLPVATADDENSHSEVENLLTQHDPEFTA